MDNLKIYEAVRSVPKEARRDIQAGRLKGKTDINPMWRIKTLTEQFGPCGFGWKYRIKEKRMEPGAKGEIAAFVDIELYIKIDGEWSDAIPGTGGSAFVAEERNGLYTSDECYKMALTDAISVACKALGVGADVYWDKGATKYTGARPERPVAAHGDADSASEDAIPTCAQCGNPIKDSKTTRGNPWRAADIAAYTMQKFSRPLCVDCATAAAESARNLVPYG